MAVSKAEVVSHEELASIIEESDIQSTVDIGVAFVSVGSHPRFGNVVCISGCGESSGLVKLS